VRLGGEQVGRWGLGVLAVTGVAGLVLAVHGWSAGGRGSTPSLAGGTPAAASAPASGTTASSPASRATASPAGAPARPTANAPGAAGSPAPAPGPKLSSEPYASVAYQIWPGPVSSAASQALTGLAVSVHQRASGLAVTAAARGQGPATSHLYSGGVRVYVIEASLGDDSGNLDYSLGDDGLVVTNAQGRIVQ
jgi:hypothetical protein